MKNKQILQQALDSLKWFVENDDTNPGQHGNEFWEDGLNSGIAVIAIIEKAITQPAPVAHFDVAQLAQEIRRVDGKHDLGAGALAEALMPFLSAREIKSNEK